MKKGWEYKTLGEIATFSRGLTYKKGDEVSMSKNVVLRSNNIDLMSGQLDLSELKYLNEDFNIPKDKKVIKDSLLICMSNGSKNHLGKVALIDVDYGYAFGGFMGLIVPVQCIKGKYLHIVMSSPKYKEYIKTLSVGANINNLKFADLSKFVIPVPPLSEQEEIVSRLDRAFEKIDTLRCNAEQSLTTAQQLFQSSLTNLLTPQPHWTMKKIGTICQIERGGSPRPISNYITDDPNGFNWIKIGDTDSQGKYIYKTKDKIKPEGLKKSRFVEVDDFLLSNSMSYGRPYILKTNGCIHDGWLVIKNYQSNLIEDFFYYLLLSNNTQRQFHQKAQGSTVSNLNIQRVADVDITFPPIKEQATIVAKLDSLSAKVKQLKDNYTRTVALCDEMKQALLKEVFE